MSSLILASASTARASLLERAGIPFSIQPASVDEESIKDAMLAEGGHPRDIADALADLKSAKVSGKHLGPLVLGCDQIASIENRILSKPTTREEATEQLMLLNGKVHHLYSAAVMYQDNRPVWRHIGTARLQMAALSLDYISDYVDHFWPHIQHTVGCYRLEEEGVRLFSRVDGDYHSVLGLPLLEVQAYLRLRGCLSL